LYGKAELEKREFVLKNLRTWESTIWVFDASFGVIPVAEIDGHKKLLMVKHKKWWHRWFPKWHPENNENTMQSASRECAEEVWLSWFVLSEDRKVVEHYFISDVPTGPTEILKTVTYYIWETTQTNYALQPDEVKEARRMTIEETALLPLSAQMKWIISELKKFL
jgi:ADP-ribose pyrophosphatase YjhB (NUDIX family)